MIRIKSPQDFGAAVVFVLIGLAGLYFGQDLAFGTSSKMGPGYFPAILSALILLIGIGLAAKALAVEGPGVEPIKLRPILFVVAVVLLFGHLLEVLGLAVTAVILTVVAAYARRQVNLTETILLGAGLAIFTVLVFVYALSQPLPAWWGQ